MFAAAAPVREETIAVPVPTLPEDPADLLVTDRERFREVCRRLSAAGRFAFDTEFIRERSYEPRVCLVQVASADTLVLIDPILLGDIREFWDLVLDPSLETVVHAGRQDLEICHVATGQAPANVFDVQIAAGLAGLPYPLGYGRLVDHLLRVKLHQGETYSEWSQRPLTPEQLRYAVEDVAYLLPLRDKLARRLEQTGRSGWLREEVSRMETRELYARDVEEPWARVRGKGGLNRRGLAILREVASFREALAKERDIPSRTLLRDDALVEVSRRRPTAARDLRGLRSFSRHDDDRMIRGLLDAVARGAEVPDEQCPELPEEREEWAPGRMLADLAAAVGQALCQAGGVSHDLFAGRSDYMELAEAVVRPPGPNSAVRPAPRLLAGWRGEFAGSALTEVLGGRAAVKVSGPAKQPKLEIAPLPPQG